jgi:hypothetical protein
LELVANASPSRAYVAAHSLAELYATLSATPAPKMRRVDAVLEAVEHAARVLTPITLTEDDYLWVLRRVAATGSRSGKIHDALVLKCGERAGVDLVYTWNTTHFASIAWPEMAGRIESPDTPRPGSPPCLSASSRR